MRAKNRGQALVEFALIIPLFLLILMGAIDVGRGVFVYNSITNGAREGARLAIVNQTTASITARAIQQTAIAETGSPNVTVLFKEATPNATFSSNANCPTMKIGCIAIVRFQTTFRPITPIVSNILWPNGVTFQAESALPIEYVCPNSSTTAGQCPKQP